MNPIIKNINILSNISTYDSLLLSCKEHRIRKDTRYLKNFRTVSVNIRRIISIIKTSFHNEIILIHLNKLNHMDTKHRISRLIKAYNGIRNLASYYNFYTAYGPQIEELIEYTNNMIIGLQQLENPRLILKSIKENVSITEDETEETEDDGSVSYGSVSYESATDDESESVADNEEEQSIGYITHIKLFVINIFTYISQTISRLLLWF